MNPILIISLASGLLVGVIYLIVSSSRERALKDRELSRAACLVEIVDLLNLTNMNLREKMKRAGRALAQEGGTGGWRCRIILQEDPSYMPPSSENLGIHIPMAVGDKVVGALVVSTPGAKLDAIDQNFFDVLARSLGLFLYKEKMWNDFHAEVERVQATLLLSSDTSSVGNETSEALTVEHLLQSLGALSGNPFSLKSRGLHTERYKVENSADNKL